MTEFGDVMFADVDREGWATAVGHSLVEAARIWVEAVPSSLITEECWLAEDLSLLFTYQLDGAALGGVRGLAPLPVDWLSLVLASARSVVFR